MSKRRWYHRWVYTRDEMRDLRDMNRPYLQIEHGPIVLAHPEDAIPFPRDLPIISQSTGEVIYTPTPPSP